MSITIEFSPQEEALIAAAAEEEGVDHVRILSRLVRTYLPQPKLPVTQVPDAENQRAIDLLRAWRAEDATDDEEELERRDAETSELLRNLEVNRLALRIPEL